MKSGQSENTKFIWGKVQISENGSHGSRPTHRQSPTGRFRHEGCTRVGRGSLATKFEPTMTVVVVEKWRKADQKVGSVVGPLQLKFLVEGGCIWVNLGQG